jgi:acyl-coenzyme A synthetase/AMP-(fatty) acid ligase
VGYGQTEASPGISLGEVGAFSSGCMGHPVGCEVRIAADGLLQFRGENACVGYWVDGDFVADNSDWRSSGDLAEWTPEGLHFIGRADDRFKLANGKMVSPSLIEERLRTLTSSNELFWVFTRDNRRLSLFYTSSSGRHLADAIVDDAFDGLRVLCDEITRQPASVFITTRKGELNRRAMLESLVPVSSQQTDRGNFDSPQCAVLESVSA